MNILLNSILSANVRVNELRVWFVSQLEVFAESMYEMLQRDFCYEIYRALEHAKDPEVERKRKELEEKKKREEEEAVRKAKQEEVKFEMLSFHCLICFRRKGSRNRRDYFKSEAAKNVRGRIEKAT